MSYTFGRPRPQEPYSVAGEKDDAAVYLPLETRVRVLVRVPGHLANANTELDPIVFEVALREACAAALVGARTADGFAVETAAVERFAPGGAG